MLAFWFSSVVTQMYPGQLRSDLRSMKVSTAPDFSCCGISELDSNPSSCHASSTDSAPSLLFRLYTLSSSSWPSRFLPPLHVPMPPLLLAPPLPPPLPPDGGNDRAMPPAVLLSHSLSCFLSVLAHPPHIQSPALPSGDMLNASTMLTLRQGTVVVGTRAPRRARARTLTFSSDPFCARSPTPHPIPYLAFGPYAKRVDYVDIEARDKMLVV